MGKPTAEELERYMDDFDGNYQMFVDGCNEAYLKEIFNQQ